MQTLRKALLCIVMLCPVSITRISAQSMGFHAVGLDVQNDALGKLFGAGFMLEVPIAGSRVHWQLAFEAAQGKRTYVGSPCVGLVAPGNPACASRTLKRSADMELAIVGIRLPLVHTKRASIAIAGDFGGARVATNTRDAADSSRFKDWKFVMRPELGVDARWQPKKNNVVSIRLGASIGRLISPSSTQIADGYAPFQDRSEFKRVWLGLMWKIPAAPARRR